MVNHGWSFDHGPLYCQPWLYKKARLAIVIYVCVIQFSKRHSSSGSAVRNHGRHASILIMFVVCLHAYVQFASLIRQTPTPTFSDTAITDRHSDTTVYQLGTLDGDILVCWIEKNHLDVPPVGVKPLTSL